MFYKITDFVKNLEELKKKYGEYFFEVLITDFFCISENINPKLMYVTPERVDQGIDSFIIQEKNKEILYVLQITSGYKDKKYLEDYEKMDVFKIPKYKEVLKEYVRKDLEVRKVFISLKWKKYYKEFSNRLMILSNENQELNLMLYEYSIKLNLINSACEFGEKYVESLYKRTKMWQSIHRKKYEKEIRELYIKILKISYSFLYELEFEFIDEIDKLIKNKVNIIIELFNKIGDETVREKILKMNKQERNIFLDVFEACQKKKIDYEPIIDLIKEITEVKNNISELRDVEVVATIQYLSIYDEMGENLAYLYYTYDRINNQRAMFCFVCKFEEIREANNKIIKKYIDEGIIEKNDKTNKGSDGKDTKVNIKKIKEIYGKENKVIGQIIKGILGELLKESIQSVKNKRNK